jgi:hypothetical protein
MPIDHLDLVFDFNRSLAFYRGLLGPLGHTRKGPIVGKRGERIFSDSDGIKLRTVPRAR